MIGNAVEREDNGGLPIEICTVRDYLRDEVELQQWLNQRDFQSQWPCRMSDVNPVFVELVIKIYAVFVELVIKIYAVFVELVIKIYAVFVELVIC